MFKEEIRLLWASVVMLVLESISLFFGQERVLLWLYGFFNLNHPSGREFLGNLLRIEGWMYEGGQTHLAGIIGFGLTLMILFGLLMLHKHGRRRTFWLGLVFLVLGFIEVLAMDISILGWLSGSMLIMAGFLLARKSRRIL